MYCALITSTLRNAEEHIPRTLVYIHWTKERALLAPPIADKIRRLVMTLKY